MRASAPRSRAIDDDPGGAAGDHREGAGHRADPPLEAQEQARAEAERERPDGDQQDREPVGGHRAQRLEVDQRAHRDADDGLPRGGRDARDGDRRRGGRGPAPGRRAVRRTAPARAGRARRSRRSPGRRRRASASEVQGSPAVPRRPPAPPSPVVPRGPLCPRGLRRQAPVIRRSSATCASKAARPVAVSARLVRTREARVDLRTVT